MAMLVAKVAFDLCSFMELDGRTKRHLSRLQGGLCMFTPAKPLTERNSRLLLLRCHKSRKQEKILQNVSIPILQGLKFLMFDLNIIAIYYDKFHMNSI